MVVGAEPFFGVAIQLPTSAAASVVAVASFMLLTIPSVTLLPLMSSKVVTTRKGISATLACTPNFVNKGERALTDAGTLTPIDAATGIPLATMVVRLRDRLIVFCTALAGETELSTKMICSASPLMPGAARVPSFDDVSFVRFIEGWMKTGLDV